MILLYLAVSLFPIFYLPKPYLFLKKRIWILMSSFEWFNVGEFDGILHSSLAIFSCWMFVWYSYCRLAVGSGPGLMMMINIGTFLVDIFCLSLMVIFVKASIIIIYGYPFFLHRRTLSESKYTREAYSFRVFDFDFGFCSPPPIYSYIFSS